MQGKVIFEVITGTQAGKRYEYDQAERIFVGRQEDCDIVLPVDTVSRYHCLLSINPPIAKLQDFGSLNGTFINDRKIGQREKNQSPEEGRNAEYTAYELHDGDRIRLGKSCEIKCSIEQPRIQSIPVSEEQPAAEGTIPEPEPLTPPKPQTPQAPSTSVHALKKKKCSGCGKSFTPVAEDNNLCPDCLLDQGKLLDAILAEILGEANRDEHLEASPVEGFDKVKCLGKGGMGEVWMVKERRTDKLYALKTMLSKVAADEKGKRQFLREAKICEQLRHKNVIRTYQTGCRNDVFFILMDLCEGGSVEDLMRKNGGKLSLNMATWIILQALDGLDYVHNMDVTAEIHKRGTPSDEVQEVKVKGLVHRDFKPGNIFLSDRGDHPVAIVADFGMAKAFETAGLTDMTGGETAGTVPFMCRQQARDYRFAKPEVDVWAAAASYYYMLTGEFPKNVKRGLLMWPSLLKEDAVPIRRRDPSVPAQIAEVIDRALVDDPEVGCKSAASLRKQIVAVLPVETRNYCRNLLPK